MRTLDSRRLTGPNLHRDGAAAIVEVAFEPGETAESIDAAIAAWRAAVTAALEALGWPVELHVRVHHDDRGNAGADLVFAAPVDVLYVATDINDWAIAAANGEVPADPGERLAEWRAAAERERLPGAAALRAEAAARDLPVLSDDDSLSIGHGRHAIAWPARELPASEDVPWDRLRRIPVALITGTNGKTTTARLLARIARKAGHVPGNTSTDGMSVDERPLEAGDWTGPGAARTVLRHPDVDLAVLEVARGGILRRGLGVDRCDAAAVLNVSADHLGEYGIHDLAAMARVKAVVGGIVTPRGRVVLGADSPPLVELVERGHRFPAPVVWFSRRADHPTIARHLAAGGEAWLAVDGRLCRARGDACEPLVAIAELPFCFGGAAGHNVANALAAAALACALGLPDPAIVAGLRSFSASVADNPGRANLAVVAGVQVFLDFAHNADGIRSLHDLIATLRGSQRLLVGIGVAGDRDDAAIREVARAVHEMRPDRVLVRDLEHYLRGREPGEVPALLRDELLAQGTPSDAVALAASEVEVLRSGLAWARPGDIVAILVHVDRDEIQAELGRLGAIADPRAGRPA
jgi:cyanophycin synthetase